MADYEFKLTPEGETALKTFEALDGAVIRVGWQAGDMAAGHGPQPKYGKKRKGKATESSKATLAEIAMYNEYGTSTAPARPFMRKSFENNQEEISTLIEKSLKKIAKSGKSQQFLYLLGVKLVSTVQSEIENGQFEANAKSVYDRKKKLSRKDAKGEPKPLIDTATMKNSVGYMIEGE